MRDGAGMRLLKHIGMIVAVIGIAIAVAGAMMILVYMIPTERMFNNARKSVGIFENEGASAQMIHGYKATALDNYTDAWMFRIAVYDGDESAVDKAFHNYFYYGDKAYPDMCQSTIAYLKDKNQAKNRADYARYWHGYQLILKPLLLIFDYGDIRQILRICTLFAVLYLAVLLERVGLKDAVVLFGGMLILLEFGTIGMSMQYTWVFLIAVAFSILILRKYKVFGENTCNWMFLIIGCMTSFFDFLTYPLFTMALPLLILCMCYGLQERKPVWSFLRYISLAAIHWGIGYAGMWSGKWICLNLFWGDGALQDGFNSILFRSGRQNTEYTFVGAVMENISMLLKWPYFMCVLFMLGMILFGVKQKQQLRVELLIAYCGIAALPFAWYFISLNHSYIHAIMTYRELSIAAFAGSLAALELKKAWNWKKDQKKSGKIPKIG